MHNATPERTVWRTDCISGCVASRKNKLLRRFKKMAKAKTVKKGTKLGSVKPLNKFGRP